MKKQVGIGTAAAVTLATLAFAMAPDKSNEVVDNLGEGVSNVVDEVGGTARRVTDNIGNLGGYDSRPSLVDPSTGGAGSPVPPGESEG